MEITKIKKYQTKKLSVSIQIDLSDTDSKYSIKYSYMCPNCSGYGCNSHGAVDLACVGGDIVEDLDLSCMDEMFPEKQAGDVRKIIEDLKSKTSIVAPMHTSKR